jgi:hypothetical protein
LTGPSLLTILQLRVARAKISLPDSDGEESSAGTGSEKVASGTGVARVVSEKRKSVADEMNFMLVCTRVEFLNLEGRDWKFALFLSLKAMKSWILYSFPQTKYVLPLAKDNSQHSL